MKSQICDLLGIEFPLFAFTHCRDVAAAVSKAGGLGVFGGAKMGADQLKIELDWIDAHVDGKTGWIVQIGATDDAGKANELLIRARAQNRSTLGSAQAVTEKVKRGGGFLYRARFAGLDAASAGQACRSLKRSGFTCFATHD